jgi:four helix bundle protein
MEYIFAFEKLEVYTLARKLIKRIYLLTKDFPSEEKFGLVSQIQRSAVSVASNIAEGNSRVSLKDKAHFFHIAYSSLMETLSHLNVSLDLAFIEEDKYCELRESIRELSNKLNSLYKSIRKE